MATKFEPRSIRNLGVYGVIRPAEVDDKLIPDGAVTEVFNFQFDRKGASTLRPGLATLGATVATQVGYPIWALHNIQNGTLLAVVSQNGSSRVYAYGGASWASNLTAGTANTKIRFVNFAERIICLNWGNATNMYSSMQVWFGRENNATWITTGSPINPQGLTDDVNPSPQPQFGEVYKSRLYLAGGDTDGSNLRLSRLWFSSVISSTGVITWTPATDYVDINPNDGENITGIKRFSLELLVFKPNYIYRFRTSGVDPDPLIKIGTRSQESIVEGKRGLYFHHDTGFYRYSGGYPVEISRPISDIVAAIPYSQFADITAWRDSDHILWTLGDLTIADIKESATWKNVVIRYTESSEVWTIYSYGIDIDRGADYNTGAALSRVVGTSTGVVATFDSGTTDLGEPITYSIRTKWYEWDGIFTNKVIQQLVAICEKAQGSELMYQTDEDTTRWHTIGQVKKFINLYNNTDIRFHRIRFKLNGTSRFEALIFQGLEITDGINEGIIE